MNTRQPTFPTHFLLIQIQIVDERHLCSASNISDPTEKAIQIYKSHSSISIIIKMVSTVDKNNTFSYEPITADDISQQIKRLDIKKVIYYIASKTF